MAKDQKSPPNYWKFVDQLVNSKSARNQVLDKAERHKELSGIETFRRQNKPFYYLTK
jgi:hypothetical protein